MCRLNKDAFPQMTAEPPPNLPLTRTVDFSLQRHFPAIPSGARIFSRAQSRDQRGAISFFPRIFQTNRFALIPPRVRFGLRLARLVGMTKTSKPENRQSLVRGRERRAPTK